MANSKIDDSAIKLLVKEFQQGNTDFAPVIEYLSTYIYNFPRIVFNASPDECSDFFEFIYAKLEKIIKNYTIQNAKFTTWLTVVLRTKYSSFKREKPYKKPLPIDNEQIIEIPDEKVIEDHIGKYTVIPDKFVEIQKIINKAPLKTRLALKLYYIDFLEAADLKLISKTFKKNISSVIEDLRQAYSKLQKKNIKSKELEENITKTFQDLIYWKEKKRKYRESKIAEAKDATEYTILLKKIEKLELQRDKLLNKKLYFRKFIDSKSIANIFGINMNAINNLLFRGKRYLQENLKYMIE